MRTLPGFTLIETLVAIAILTIAITIPYYSVEKALVASYVARDKLTAASLAQEGLEYVRGVRDANYIYNYDTGSTLSWMANLDGTSGGNGFTPANCIAPNSCVVDVRNNTATTCVNNDPFCLLQPLYLSGGMYTQNAPNGTPPSRFTRAVQITQITPTEDLVVSTVTWKTACEDNSLGQSARVSTCPIYTVSVQEYLENWLQ